MKKQVSLFDFDGTLTTCDTLFSFIIFSKGRIKLYAELFKLLPWLVLMKLRLYSNALTKQRLFSSLFKDMPVQEFDSLCQSFALSHRHLLRVKGMETLTDAIKAGNRVFIVTASIDKWVLPFFKDLPQVHVIGTQAEVKDERLTGRFATPNCHGAEKVRRVQQLFLPREEYEITAYGDSRGDKEMLNYADKRYYRPFRD